MDPSKLFNFLVTDLVSHPFRHLLFFALLAFTVCAFLVGLGYRRLARAIGVGVSIAIFGSIAAVIFALFAAPAVVGRGEGAGIALLILFLLAGAGTFIVSVLAAAIWIIWKRKRYVVKAEKSPTWLAVGVVSLVPALMLLLGPMLRIAALSRTTIVGSAESLSSEQLASQVISLRVSYYQSEATQELRRRGTAAAPAIIQALHTVPDESARQFESSETIGLLALLSVLGDIGGPEAIQELRGWLNRDAAPDVRGTAAAGLGTAGDRESAAAMAQFLHDRSYEWRTQHPWIVRALGQLDAKEELPAIREALVLEPNDGASGFAVGLLREGAVTLAKFDTPESWQAIADLTAGDPKVPEITWRQDTIREALKEIGREPPTPK